MGEDKETQDAVKAAMAQHAKLVVGDDLKRQEMCMREIRDALAKYDCSLVPRCMISPMSPTGGGVEFMVETVAIPRDVIEEQKLKKAEKIQKMHEEAAARGERHARQAGPMSEESEGQSGQEEEEG